MITEAIKKEERHQRAVAIARQMLANKHAAQQEAIEAYKNDPTKQALVAELRRQNEERGTPIVRIPY